jgi:nucleoside-diphosphate-sugar epimerase
MHPVVSAGRHVIVGGLGNVGRHLQKTLLEQGRAIVVLDRQPSSSASLLSAPPLFAHKSVEFCPFTLGTDDTLSLVSALKDADVVYSVVTPDVEFGTKKDFHQTNVIGIKNLIEACRTAGVPKLVYASSLAVTNHFLPSINANESDALPSMDSYLTSYDLTKRQGEDMVLAANDGNNFKTCALRLGGVLASVQDYYLRRNYEMGESTGIVYTVPCERIDTIAAKDVATALSRASDSLDRNPSLAGKALFVTKSKNEHAPTATDIARLLVELNQWKLQVIPSFVYSCIRRAVQLQYNMSLPFRQTDKLPGIPPHMYMQVPLYEQTFDNSLARKTLQWAPEWSWEETLESIVNDNRSSKRI